MAAADALGLPRDQVEEMSVPTYGMEQVGVRRETFAVEGAIAEIRVDGRDAELCWMRADGTPQKSVPAKVKTDQREALKELQGGLKDIKAMLPAQSERLDSMFLQEKRWPLAAWREHYLDQPLVGTIARRLIWTFERPARARRAGSGTTGNFVDATRDRSRRPTRPRSASGIRSGCSADEVLAWRSCLERHEVRQPFKQAHREVYLLTDAERNTRTYSNRFAAHVLRQHQFNALAAARGWRNKLRLMVDDTYPPATRELPRGACGPSSGSRASATTTAPTPPSPAPSSGWPPTRSASTALAARREHRARRRRRLRAAARQARRRPINEPLPLDADPAAGVQRGMRDVDLFVGVASVGNDPTWQDGGPEGRYRDYWSATPSATCARPRRPAATVLERLVPRLKIADRCTLRRPVPRRPRRPAHLQDPPRERQHPDGAERPVPVHRPGRSAPRRHGGERLPAVRGRPTARAHPQQGVPAGRRHRRSPTRPSRGRSAVRLRHDGRAPELSAHSVSNGTHLAHEARPGAGTKRVSRLFPYLAVRLGVVRLDVADLAKAGGRAPSEANPDHHQTREDVEAGSRISRQVGCE